MARTADLPVHFRTGLRAVGIVNGRPIWPIFGGEESADAAAQAAAKAAADAQAAKDAEGERGYPLNTAVAEMTDKQQAAYFKAQNRKQEDRNKAVGLTPDEAKQLRERAAKADEYEAANANDAEKREKAARDAAVADADAKYKPLLVETAFRVSIGDRKTKEEVDDFILNRNLSRFLTDDGNVDTARVLAEVEQYAPGKGNQQQRGPSSNGQGAHSTRTSGQAASGRDLYAERHKKKSTVT